MEYYYGQAWVMGKTEVHIRELVFILPHPKPESTHPNPSEKKI